MHILSLVKKYRDWINKHGFVLGSYQAILTEFLDTRHVSDKLVPAHLIILDSSALTN
jgi:hypothetical protein